MALQQVGLGITASDVIGFSEWQCNPGSTVHAFSGYPLALVRKQVDYFLQRKEFTTISGEYTGSHGIAMNTATNGDARHLFRGDMRIPPAITSTAAATFDVRDQTAAFKNCSAFAGSNPTIHGTNFAFTSAAATVGPVSLTRDGTDVCWFMADARL